MKNPQISLIIFDLDGTLVETRQDITAAVNYARIHFGYEPLSLETVCSFVGDGIQKLMKRAFPDFDTDKIASTQKIFGEYYSQHLTDNSFIYPGIIEFLDQNRDLKMAVLSNKTHIYTDAIIRQLEIDHYFTVIMGSMDEFPRKPKPEAIIHIMETLKIKPQNSIIIGDTKNDVLAGKAAGIYTCAVTYGFRSREVLCPLNADFIVDTIIELQDLFQSFKSPRV
jgi:phosphoglycolate phosphatase